MRSSGVLKYAPAFRSANKDMHVPSELQRTERTTPMLSPVLESTNLPADPNCLGSRRLMSNIFNTPVVVTTLKYFKLESMCNG